MQAQFVKMNKGLARRRKPLVDLSTHESEEWKSFNFLQGEFVQCLNTVFSKLQTSANDMERCIQSSIPYFNHALLSLGNDRVEYCPLPISEVEAEHSQEELQENCSQVNVRMRMLKVEFLYSSKHPACDLRN